MKGRGMLRVIPRLAVKRITGPGLLKVRAGLLGEEKHVEIYEVQLEYLLLQDPRTVEVFPLTPGGDRKIEILDPPYTEYCRWHNGPLDAPDNPLKRIYCNMPARDYCRQHSRTPRSIYEKCVTLRGGKGLAYCGMLDRIVKSEYTVYLTDFGGSKPKVGMTRRFRYLERIAEQPHITATVLAVTDSAVEARKLEMEISSLGLAQETRRAQLRFSVRSLGESAARLEAWARRISSKVGLGWDGPILSVRPPQDIGSYREPGRGATPSMLWVEGYWGGYLLLKAPGGPGFRINFRRLQHRDSVRVLDV